MTEDNIAFLLSRLLCCVCGKPVRERNGSVFVRDVALVLEKTTAAIARNRKRGVGKRFLSPSEVLELEPEMQPWEAAHDDCYLPTGSDYCIGLERFRTWKEVADWTEHLWAKRWFYRTDWAALLRAGGAFASG